LGNSIAESIFVCLWARLKNQKEATRVVEPSKMESSDAAHAGHGNGQPGQQIHNVGTHANNGSFSPASSSSSSLLPSASKSMFLQEDGDDTLARSGGQPASRPFGINPDVDYDLSDPAVMEALIAKLCEMPLGEAIKDARLNGFKIDMLKAMAAHLNLPKARSKPTLVENIIKKRQSESGGSADNSTSSSPAASILLSPASGPIKSKSGEGAASRASLGEQTKSQQAQSRHQQQQRSTPGAGSQLNSPAAHTPKSSQQASSAGVENQGQSRKRALSDTSDSVQSGQSDEEGGKNGRAKKSASSAALEKVELEMKLVEGMMAISNHIREMEARAASTGKEPEELKTLRALLKEYTGRIKSLSNNKTVN
jgi:hypothetical protein